MTHDIARASRVIMSDEFILIAALLAGLAIMIAVVVLPQRRKERLVRQSVDVEIPIESVPRTVAVMLPAAVVFPVGVGIVGKLTDPWMRSHALGAVLTGVGGAVVTVVLAMMASRRWRRVGALTLTQARLELSLPLLTLSLDVQRPFRISEASAIGAYGMQYQVVVVTQGEQSWGFSYMLPVGRPPYGDRAVDEAVPPLLGGEVRVIHDRLRALASV
jgi:hypothetical protein